ncbi:MAG TPA: hypothetical protein VKG25_23435, partial [Bryobacteraceae bacterium]|nr:hypothetical protein [Bryobacteraceae bacterium]
MDTTAVTLLGQQLKDFLVKQFAPPPGTKTCLGFLGTGVAVDPNSFLSSGQFNPARVNQWLDIVVDPLGEVIAGTDQVEFMPWTATQLLQAIYSQAMSVAPADSDAQRGFAKAKSQALEGLGGATTVSTAPLDWYDPAHLPQWPACSLTANSTTSSGAASGTKVTPAGPPPARPLWAWRRLETMPVPAATPVQAASKVAAAPPAPALGTAAHPINTLQMRRVAFAAAPMVAAAARPAPPPRPVSPIMSAHLAPLGHPAATAQAVQVSRISMESRISVERMPTSVIGERAVTPTQALMVSHAAFTASNQAATSSVATNSLSLRLKYQVVSLSRAPWWNEFLMLLDNWYIPSCGRASMIEDSDAQKVFGVPIALVLTSDVNIQANWSAADRTAATSNTHFGPWALNSAKFLATSNAGEAILAIPGIQAIACIYRQLPPLPPKSDPSLGVPVGAVSSAPSPQASAPPASAPSVSAPPASAPPASAPQS